LISVRLKGSFANIEKFLSLSQNVKFNSLLDSYGAEGVNALNQVTPRDSGLTSNSWEFEKVFTPSGFKIIWTNSNLVDGVPVAILVQYGHATKNGTVVEGRDYINPAMAPIFDGLADRIWKEVKSR
jgi:hypothetical protein